MHRHPGRGVIAAGALLFLAITARPRRNRPRPPPQPRPRIRHHPVRSGALVAVIGCVLAGPSLGNPVRQTAAVFTGTDGNSSDSLSARGNFAFSSAVISSGPVSYWPLDESSGSTAHDVVGTNPITYNAGTTLGAAGAIAHDSDTAITHGLNQDATANNPSTLNISGNLSVMAWEKSAGAQSASNARVVAKYDGTNINYLMAWSGTTTTMRFLVDDSPGNGASSSNRLTASSTVSTTDGLWHMLVGTWDGSNCKLYVDGALKSTTAGTGSASVMTNTSPVTLGLSNASMVGTIDEVAVWSKALTAAQISNLYTLGTT
jgi:hypothetical protein